MPSWMSGIARTLDISGQFDHYNDSPAGDIADSRALLSDWRVVGDTILDAVRAFRGETQTQATPGTDSA